MSRAYADPIDVRRAPQGSRAQEPRLSPRNPQGSRVQDPRAAQDPRAQDPLALPADAGDPLEQCPAQFLWRGRVYVVREVIAQWIESSAWWGGSRQSLEGAIPMHEHEVWRVEAQSGRSGCPGVYDLRRDVAADRWVLARAMD